MSISSRVFNKDYYCNVCLGSEDFKKSKGLKLNKAVKQMIDGLDLEPSMRVLEIGCGRGDTAIYIAKKVNSIVGIDYSIDAIEIANEIRSNSSVKIKNKTKFYRMKADKLNFKDDEFDMLIFVDTIDHLNNMEVEKTMLEIKRVLKPSGKLFIKTCSNKTILDLTYKYYIYPLNKLITNLDKKIKNLEYNSLLRDPRTKEAKIQHINEPNYFYLRNLFIKFGFKGNIKAQTGFLTEDKRFRSKIYNFIVTFYPISKYFPINVFFAGNFQAVLTNNK